MLATTGGPHVVAVTYALLFNLATIVAEGRAVTLYHSLSHIWHTKKANAKQARFTDVKVTKLSLVFTCKSAFNARFKGICTLAVL